MNHTCIGQRIKEKREQNGLSLQDIATKLDVNRSSVMRWENGETERIKLPIIEKLAQILKTTPKYLLGYDSDMTSVSRPCSSEDACYLPVLKHITAREQMFCEENILYYEIADARYQDNCHFFLPVSGDSMAPRLEDGDCVLVRCQEQLGDGDLGVFIIDGIEQTIKEFHHTGQLELCSFNPYYPRLRFSLAESNRFKIIGKVLESKKRW